MSAAGEARAPRTVPLPELPRAPLLLLLGLGLLLLVAALATDLGSFGLILAGHGIAIAGFVLAILLNRETTAKLEIDERGGWLAVVSREGGRATIPMAALTGAEAAAEGSSGSVPGLWLVKRQGGRIQLARFKHPAEAQDLATQLGRALARCTGEGSAASSPEDRLASTPQVRASRQRASAPPHPPADDPQPTQEPALHLIWPAARPGRATAPSLLGTGGVALIAYGLYVHGTGPWPALLVGLFAALLATAMLAGLRQLGLSQSVTIDDEQLSVEHLRGVQVLRRQTMPTNAVGAVDSSQELSTRGGLLTFRAARAEEATEPPDLQISLGPLSLADRINVDLAISDELFRRHERRTQAR